MSIPENLKGVIWGAAGVILTGILVGVWDAIRPMTKQEHAVDIDAVATKQEAILMQLQSNAKVSSDNHRNWECSWKIWELDTLLAQGELDAVQEERKRRLQSWIDDHACTEFE